MTSEVTQADIDLAVRIANLFGKALPHDADTFPAQWIAEHRLTAQSGEGRSGAGEDAALKLVAGYVDYTTESKDRWEQGKAAGYRELGSIVAAALNARQSGEGEREALREALDAAHFYIDASPDELADLGITRDDALRMARDKRAALNARQSGEGEREEFLTAYVSEDAKVIGIEHDTDADWHKVYDAHVALRDRLEERIREREKCPRKPALRATDDAGWA